MKFTAKIVLTGSAALAAYLYSKRCLKLNKEAPAVKKPKATETKEPVEEKTADLSPAHDDEMMEKIMKEFPFGNERESYYKYAILHMENIEQLEKGLQESIIRSRRLLAEEIARKAPGLVYDLSYAKQFRDMIREEIRGLSGSDTRDLSSINKESVKNRFMSILEGNRES